MNICYLIQSFSTQAGTESYIYNISIAMAKMGHKVHIVSLTGNGQWDYKGFENKIYVHQVSLKKDPFRGLWRLEKFFPIFAWRYGILLKKVLPAIIKNQSIDIIEATDWGIDAWRYLPGRQIPICVRLHGYPGFKDEFVTGKLKKMPKNYIYWNILRRQILGADLVTGVSRSYTNFVKEAWDIKEKEISIIPIAVDLNVFYPKENQKENQKILFAGRLETSKGIGVLAKAIPLIINKIPEARFYFAGEDYRCNKSQQTWSQLLKKSFYHEHIIYLGSLSTQKLVEYYQTSTICVIPSLYEPGATVAFEAMACGCPVIASRVGGLEEVIKDRETGILTPPGDAEALAENVIELLQQSELRRKISKKAYALICENYDLNIIAQQIVNTYAAAIKKFNKMSFRNIESV